MEVVIIAAQVANTAAGAGAKAFACRGGADVVPTASWGVWQHDVSSHHRNNTI